MKPAILSVLVLDDVDMSCTTPFFVIRWVATLADLVAAPGAATVAVNANLYKEDLAAVVNAIRAHAGLRSASKVLYTWTDEAIPAGVTTSEWDHTVPGIEGSRSLSEALTRIRWPRPA